MIEVGKSLEVAQYILKRVMSDSRSVHIGDSVNCPVSVRVHDNNREQGFRLVFEKITDRSISITFAQCATCDSIIVRIGNYRDLYDEEESFYKLFDLKNIEGAINFIIENSLKITREEIAKSLK